MMEFENRQECPVCLTPFGTTYGCREDRMIRFRDGGELSPVRYGHEEEFQGVGYQEQVGGRTEQIAPIDPCICGAMPGAFHHLGCTREECPRCGEEYVSCDCSTAEKHRLRKNEQRRRNR